MSTSSSPAPSLAPAQAPAAGSKRKLSILGALSSFKVSATPNNTAIDDCIKAEIDKFEVLKLTAGVEPAYSEGGFFHKLKFYNDYQKVLPIHTKVFRADVGSMKGAAACIESVFSGVKRLLGDFAATMSPEVLELYVFMYYNWQYAFMRPSIEEIVKTYLEIYGSKSEDQDSDEEEELEPDAEDAEGEADPSLVHL